MSRNLVNPRIQAGLARNQRHVTSRVSDRTSKATAARHRRDGSGSSRTKGLAAELATSAEADYRNRRSAVSPA